MCVFYIDFDEKVVKNGVKSVINGVKSVVNGVKVPLSTV